MILTPDERMIDALDWIRAVSGDDSIDDVNGVARLMERGNIKGEWVGETLLIDPSSLRDDSNRWPVESTPPPPVSGWVYLVAAPDVSRVKIGWTTSVKNRVRQLNLGSPVPLVLLNTIDAFPAIERDLHRRFAERRLHGEWFEDCAEIREAFGL